MARTAPLHLPTLLLTVLLAGVGGALARLIHLPLPMLLGPLLVVATVSLVGWRPMGHLPQFPMKLRNCFVPIVGVAIGASFTPEIVRQAAQWWPSLLAIALFIPTAHMVCFRAVKSTGLIDPVTAFFGTAPGGLIDAVQMGEDKGADVPMLTMLQFLRLIVTIVTVPVFFSVLTGHAVGSSGGATLSRGPLALADVPWLLAAGISGALLGKWLKMPGAMVTGPLVISAAVHLAGVVQGSPPTILVNLTQMVIGAALGVRFAGMEIGRFWLAIRLAALSTSVSITLAIACAFALHRFVDEPMAAVFLAFAPGGLTEMSLIALSLQMSIVYVTAHHALRIILAVLVARALADRLAK
ncbi:MAG TPA: AbrB family transcriptional regulator [Paenirhodobacter sp.]